MLWNRLTDPSPRLIDGLERRQARVLAAALVFILPVWCGAVAVSFATRPNPPTPWELVLASVFTGLAVAAYGISRTRRYQVAVIILIVTSVLGSNIAALEETDRVRATVSMLYGATGALYASVFMNTRATFIAAIASMACFVFFGTQHPSLMVGDFTIPLFLLGFVLALTVVAGAVRESQLDTIKGQAAHLTAIFDSTTDAVAAINRDGLVRLWSPHASALFQVDGVAALGRPLAELVAASHSIERVREALTNGAPRFEFSSPQSRSFEASLAPLKDGTGAVVVLRDVTERKQLEARLMLTDRLETMGRMVAGVAHEINNPLSYVQANLRALSDGDAHGKERGELLSETLEGTRRIQTIVKDLLTFSRSPADREEISAVLIENTLDSAMQIAQVHASNAHATLIRQFSTVGTVMASEARLGQVFLTLIMNAIQALPSSGGRREIIVSTRLVGRTVVVGVRDFGEGMTAEVRAKLFTPFFTTKPVGKGTGLGLSIAHSIMRALNGEIRVESAVGQGALFEVVLPITPEDATAASGE